VSDLTPEQAASLNIDPTAPDYVDPAGSPAAPDAAATSDAAPPPQADPGPAAPPASDPAPQPTTTPDAPIAPDPQPNTDAPAPADVAGAGATSQADLAAPQMGGATVADQTSLEQANAAKDDPGYVVAKPLLTTGAYGHDVAVLAMLLHEAGYPNPVHAGLEAPMLTDEIMRMVRAFQEAHGIDPAGPQPGVEGDGPAGAPLVRRDHEGIVDGRTWAELYDAADVDVEIAVAEIRYPAGSFA
jgi:hypothetical protein